ncbi:MAG: RDD family protein [Actinomycetia bacterium]|nr:RDD family protein [Actinomycetes bacterium]
MAQETPKETNTALDRFKDNTDKGFLRNRFLALIVDLIVVTLLCQLVFTFFGLPDWPGYLQMQDAVIGLERTDPLVLERMRLYQVAFLYTLGIATVYESVMLILFRATIGKLIFRMRVEPDKESDSGLVRSLRYILRTLVKMSSIYLLSAVPFIFMCLTAFANEERRSGFDLFAGTRVIDLRKDRS